MEQSKVNKVNNPIRVAQIMGKMNNGGVEAVVMNYYRNIDRTKIQFDFIVDNDSSCPQKEEIESLGGRVFYISPYTKLKKYNSELKDLFLKNKYEIVHSHITTLNVFPLRIAKKCHVKVRISHAHSTAGKGEFVRNCIKYILRPFSKVYANYYFACGEYAGRWLYGKKTFKNGKITIINNAIDISKFAFDNELRKKVRYDLKIDENCTVIGHIGRFVKQKNHLFLLDVFSTLCSKNKNIKLLLIGNGPLVKDFMLKAKKHNILSNIIYIESTKNIFEYYNAMDIFVLPSIYEGLPVVGVEAQYNGLTCLFSNRITKEISLLDSSKFIELDVNKWVDEISNNNYLRNHSIKDRKYEIKTEAIRLEKIYLAMNGVI